MKTGFCIFLSAVMLVLLLFVAKVADKQNIERKIAEIEAENEELRQQISKIRTLR